VGGVNRKKKVFLTSGGREEEGRAGGGNGWGYGVDVGCGVSEGTNDQSCEAVLPGEKGFGITRYSRASEASSIALR
jgi:hypothetical protein